MSEKRRGVRKNGYSLSLEDDLGIDPAEHITIDPETGRETWSYRILEQLDRQIVRALQAEAPQTCRQLFYRMTGGQVINAAKTDKHARRVQDRILTLRRNGIIAPDQICDETRGSRIAYAYANAADYLRTAAHWFRSDIWKDASCYVEVLCEARGLAGTIDGTCHDYGVTVTGLGGFMTVTLANSIGVRARGRARGRPIVFLHVGDYDPSGKLIDKNSKRELLETLGDFEYRRIAVTPEQIAAYDLPIKPAKDSPHNREGMKEAVEAESLPSDTLRTIVADALDELLPRDALKRAHAFDANEQDRLLAAAKAL